MLPEHPDPGAYHADIEDDLAEGGGNLLVRVVSPQREVYAGRANWIVAPGAAGSFGVWPRHVSMVATLTSGMLRVGLPDHEKLEWVVRGSFLSVKANVVTVLIDEAITSPGDIDLDAVRGELDELTARLREALDERAYADALEQREWCRERIRFVERKPDWVPQNV